MLNRIKITLLLLLANTSLASTESTNSVVWKGGFSSYSGNGSGKFGVLGIETKIGKGIKSESTHFVIAIDVKASKLKKDDAQYSLVSVTPKPLFCRNYSAIGVCGSLYLKSFSISNSDHSRSYSTPAFSLSAEKIFQSNWIGELELDAFRSNEIEAGQRSTILGTSMLVGIGTLFQ